MIKQNQIHLKCILISILFLSACSLPQKQAENMKTKNMLTIPEIEMTEIPGAPLLSQPFQIQGEIDEIVTEKHGYAYPVMFDWNKDGLKDLLIGEFETGKKGSYIQVYINKGSNKKPAFTGKFNYAKDIKGDTITSYYWCCIGIHPRFIDLTGDGIEDMVTGSYQPGIITMWEGTMNGFKPGQEVEQEGNTRISLHGIPLDDNRSTTYWNYTSVDFGDFNMDGLQDAFIGGSAGLRVALNIGTSTKPKFGYRNFLLDIDGNVLNIHKTKNLNASPSGDMKTYIHPIDWDNDGILDLLVTSSYAYEDENPIDFFKGINTDKGIRFEQKKSLFKNNRAFPGSCTQVQIQDYNDDGVSDLIIGMSIPCVNGWEMMDTICWTPAHTLEISLPGKDKGRLPLERNIESYYKSKEYYIKRSESTPKYKIPEYYTRELNMYDSLKYSIRHRGYIYVMLGSKNKLKAKSKSQKAGNFKSPVQKTESKNLKGISRGPVSYTINIPKTINAGEAFTIDVNLTLENSWYLYADTKSNRTNEYHVTEVIVKSSSKNTRIVGELIKPEIIVKNGAEVYLGQHLQFSQAFQCSWNVSNTTIDVTIKYQTCNDGLCQPPIEINKSFELSTSDNSL